MTTYTPLARCLAFVLSLAILHPRGLLAQVNVSTQGGGGGTWTGGDITSASSFLDGANFSIKNTADPTKQLRFDVSGVTTGTARTLTVPNVSSTIAVLGLAQTFTAGQQFPTGTVGTNGIQLGAANTGLYAAAGSQLQIAINGVAQSVWASNIMRNGSTWEFGWTSAADPQAANNDTGLLRQSAGVLKLTSGAGAAVRGYWGLGTTVASAAALPVPTGEHFHVSGSTGITSVTLTGITSTCFTMIFDGTLTVTDGSNLKLAGNLSAVPDTTLSLCCDSTNCWERGRSIN